MQYSTKPAESTMPTSQVNTETKVLRRLPIPRAALPPDTTSAASSTRTSPRYRAVMAMGATWAVRRSALESRFSCFRSICCTIMVNASKISRPVLYTVRAGVNV